MTFRKSIKKYLKKNFKVDKKVSKTIPNAKNFEDVSRLKNTKNPTIAINISQKILETSPKKVASDFRMIQRVFQYADITIDKRMSDLMHDDK